MTPYKSGYFAEFVCRMYMRLLGYSIIAKNYRCGTGRKTPYGELDFVAKKGNNLVFCEVKKRKSVNDFFRALSYKQQQRILFGGQYFMEHNKKYKKFAVRYDVFFVRLPFFIKHIKNALVKDKL